jgi:Protein of unknown function (DUF2939)
MKLIRWLVIICVVLLLVYGASPYFSFWRFTAAVQSHDAAAISSRVDFPAVRASREKATGDAFREPRTRSQALE